MGEISQSKMRRAVFFDRDGTLNVEVGHLRRLDHFEMYQCEIGRAHV